MEWKVIRRRRDTNLVTCSVCLRVRRGSAWIEPEDVITALRSYELESPPRLLPASATTAPTRSSTGEREAKT